MISLEEARRILVREAARPAVIRLPLGAVSGLILAKDVKADRAIPPFDRAAVDGYAVRLRGPWQEGEEFAVLGLVQAGQVWAGSLKPGTAVKIMTGAPVPKGTDAVVMVERSEAIAPDRVRLCGPWEAPGVPGGGSARPGISEQGEDAPKGSIVLARGERLRPSRIGLLAGVGLSEVPVFRPPSVSILTTGREIVGPGERPSAAQVRDSNGPLLNALLSQAGFSVLRQRRVARDALLPLRAAIRRETDGGVLILTGGVSAGDFDLVPDALCCEGYRVCFHKVAMRPGKPVLFGVQGPKRSRRVVFGLPGNPVSVLVAAVELVLPYLRAWAGWPVPGPATLQAVAEKTIRRRSGLSHLVLSRARLQTDGRLLVREIPSRGSGDYVSAGRANCLLVLPAEDPMVPEGGIASIHLIDDMPAGGE